MTKPRRVALRRADRALQNAAFAVMFGLVPALAFHLYTDVSPAAAAEKNAAEKSVVYHSPSAVELTARHEANEQTCLAEAIYFEARGEVLAGQKAVAEVILQRTHDRNYPKTICGVVYQGAERRRGCQFSFACDGSLIRPKSRAAWAHARELANDILEGEVKTGGITSRAVAFHSVNVTPAWAQTMMFTAQIGNHMFYRWAPNPAPGETPDAAEVIQAAAGPDAEKTPAGGILTPGGEILPVNQVSAESQPSEKIQPKV